ncbi:MULTISPECIES: DUF4252 domain-containing protein [unclassified Dysgonomonas]|uniref:DUF4252 domain-containing protein n=1 Tax=unclassified Dysgonomonas TaxID=2630389 RepID=UPI0013ED94E3|nr:MULTISPECIES: DUF4252 domain-containing protein [unclassified Dysgonomonas]
MKKYLFCLILTFVIGQAAYAQGVEQLMAKFSKVDNVENVKIGGFLMSCAKIMGGGNDAPIAKGIQSMAVYDLGSCSASIKNDYAQQISKLKDGGGYETLIQVKDGNEGVRIMIKKEKDLIREIVILCQDNDPAIVHLKGKIKESDIAELVNKYNK